MHFLQELKERPGRLREDRAGFNGSHIHVIIVPLKAIVDEEIIIGPDLSKEEWADLKSRHRKGLPVRMGCCGAARTFTDLKKRNPALLSRGCCRM